MAAGPSAGAGSGSRACGQPAAATSSPATPLSAATWPAARGPAGHPGELVQASDARRTGTTGSPRRSPAARSSPARACQDLRRTRPPAAIASAAHRPKNSGADRGDAGGQRRSMVNTMSRAGPGRDQPRPDRRARTHRPGRARSSRPARPCPAPRKCTVRSRKARKKIMKPEKARSAALPASPRRPPGQPCAAWKPPPLTAASARPPFGAGPRPSSAERAAGAPAVRAAARPARVRRRCVPPCGPPSAPGRAGVSLAAVGQPDADAIAARYNTVPAAAPRRRRQTHAGQRPDGDRRPPRRVPTRSARTATTWRSPTPA